MTTLRVCNGTVAAGGTVVHARACPVHYGETDAELRRLRNVEFEHAGCAGLREHDNAELIRQRDEARACWRQWAIGLTGFRHAIRVQAEEWLRDPHTAVEGERLNAILADFAEALTFTEYDWQRWRSSGNTEEKEG